MIIFLYKPVVFHFHDCFRWTNRSTKTPDAAAGPLRLPLELDVLGPRKPMAAPESSAPHGALSVADVTEVQHLRRHQAEVLRGPGEATRWHAWRAWGARRSTTPRRSGPVGSPSMHLTLSTRRRTGQVGA